MEEKKNPKFWKGDPAGGFATGLFSGVFVGIVNILFLHWWHIGIFVFLAIWLFQGTHPSFKEKAEKRVKEDAKYKEAEKFVHNLSDNTKTVSDVVVNSVQSEKRVRKPFGALVCPHCKSANVQVLSNTNNVKKVKKTTSLNIDPLHPLTPFKHNEKVVKKHSKLKVAAAVSTFGASTLVTGGTRSNKSHQYQCRDCGKVWTRK